VLAVGNCHVFDGSFVAWYVWVGWERREGEREGGREGGRMRQGMGERGERGGDEKIQTPLQYSHELQILQVPEKVWSFRFWKWS